MKTTEVQGPSIEATLQLWEIICDGLDLRIEGDDSKAYDNARSEFEASVSDFAIIAESFVWAEYQKNNSSTVMDGLALPELDYQNVFDRLTMLSNMFRKIDRKLWDLHRLRRDQERKEQA